MVKLMIRRHITLAARNLVKNKFSTLISVVVLSAAMAASILLFQFVNFELSYDDFNSQADRIYRVIEEKYQNSKLVQRGLETYSGISVAMKAAFSEVADYTRILPSKPGVISSGAQKLEVDRGLIVENSFLQIFSYPLEYGDKAKALMEPYSVVLTESLAKNLFGLSSDSLFTILGKAVFLGRNPIPYKITGICRDVPENSHLQFDYLTSYVTLYKGKIVFSSAENDFTEIRYYHYVLLKPGVHYMDLEAKLGNFSQHLFPANRSSGNMETFFLQPLTKVHLYSDFEFEIADVFSANIVWGMFIIAIVILSLAWINYIGLTVAVSTHRSKEAAIKKILGASRLQLMAQFMTESLMVNALALIGALIAVLLAQPFISAIVHHPLPLREFAGSIIGGNGFGLLLVLCMLTGNFISGLYPAMILTLTQPVSIVRGALPATSRGGIFLKGMIVGQFALTVILLSGSIVINQQMKFLNRQDLGFNMSQMLIVKPPSLSARDTTMVVRQNTFVDEVRKITGVSGAAYSICVPGEELGQDYTIRMNGQPGNIQDFMCRNGVSTDFFQLYQTKMLAGRAFSMTDYKPNGTILNNIILNYTAVRRFGLKQPGDAVGRVVSIAGYVFTVVGVVADFHQQSLHYPVNATVFYPASGRFGSFSIKIDGSRVKAILEAIKQKYEGVFPGNFFGYFFLDDHFNKQYGDDLLLGKMFGIFSVLATVIACLGLLGLSLYITDRRTKEIGIRKVLGASAERVVVLLTKSFVQLVLVAIVIAIPVSWLVMDKWLQNFASRIHISPWVFVTAGSVALVTSLLSIGIQTVKAALTNPVDSLRVDG